MYMYVVHVCTHLVQHMYMHVIDQFTNIQIYGCSLRPGSDTNEIVYFFFFFFLHYNTWNLVCIYISCCYVRKPLAIFNTYHALTLNVLVNWSILRYCPCVNNQCMYLSFCPDYVFISPCWKHLLLVV